VYTKYVCLCVSHRFDGQLVPRIGIILSRYKSGPLPKAFKMIPSLPQWARVLALTNPSQWTPHSTLAATRIFISNLKPEQARVYLEGILLERVRTNIQEHHEGRKLDVQLYDALKKAIYKPGAFFKGILFPLLQVCLDYLRLSLGLLMSLWH
jgi:essential nuclear protein 1